MAEVSVKNGTRGGIGNGAARRDEYSDASFGGGKKWEAFKSAFRFGTDKTALGKTVLTSAFCILMCLPGIAWVIVFTALFVSKVGTSMPYGAFDGIGYPSGDTLTQGLNSALLLGNMRYYQYALIQYAVLIPCIMLAAVGAGGLIYTARRAMSGERIKVVRTFFTGVKYTWSSAIVAGLLIGANIFLIVFCSYVFDAYMLGLAGKIVTIILSSVLLVFVAIYSGYLMTLAANYRMSLPARLKDAFLLTFRALPNNLLSMLFVGLIAGGATLLIVLLGAMSTFGTLVWFIMFFFGFYAIAAILTAFSQPVFNKYITEGMLDRESHAATEQSYAAIRAQKAAGERKKKKSNAPAAFVNPKKKKKAENAEKEKAKPVAEKKEPKKTKGFTEEEIKQFEEDKKKLAEESAESNLSEALEDLSAYEDDGE